MPANAFSNARHHAVILRRYQPSFTSAHHQRLQGREDRPIELTVKKILEEQRFRDKRNHFAVKRRREPHPYHACRRECIPWSFARFVPLPQPATRSQQAQCHAQITTIRMSVLADFIQTNPCRRRIEKPEHSAVSQCRDSRRQRDSRQMIEDSRPDGCLFVFHRQRSSPAKVTELLK